MGVNRYLLDTHAVLWLAADPGQMPPTLLATLADPNVELLISAASAMEVATKLRTGKLPQEFATLVPAWAAMVRDLRARELTITSQHALLAGTMPWEHRDPFDRFLVAQAMTENLTLVTCDENIRAYRLVSVLWV